MTEKKPSTPKRLYFGWIFLVLAALLFIVMTQEADSNTVLGRWDALSLNQHRMMHETALAFLLSGVLCLLIERRE